MTTQFIRQFIQRGFRTVGLFAILFAAGIMCGWAQDVWTQKADFGGTARASAVGFSIGNKGYIGTGADNGGDKNDFWEYDPAINSWTQKADFSGTARREAVGFSIGTKGYIGTGQSYDGSIHYKNDFWEYDPTTNAWTKKADFGGTARRDAVGFSIGSKGYIGTGWDGGHYQDDFWEYDIVTDSWTQKANFAGIVRSLEVAFSIGSKGYIGTGKDISYSGFFNKEFWEYNPSTNAWTKKANFGGTARNSAIGFSIGGKGYIGIGLDKFGNKNDIWEYDPAINGWTQKADFGGTARNGAVGFSIGSKGYIGIGWEGYNKNDFWEYTPEILSCAVPSNLSVTNITSSSAKLKWDEVLGSEGYTVRYKVPNTSEWKYGTTYNKSKPISELLPNTIYKWEVQTFCHVAPNIMSDWSLMEEFSTGPLRVGDELLQQISFQIDPNPADGYATIQFTLPQRSHICIKVYDMSGREIETLLNDDMEQGDHFLLFNTNHFSTGVYFVKMISDFGIENRKLIVQ